MLLLFFSSSRRRHTRCSRDWSSDVCSSDLGTKYSHVTPWEYVWQQSLLTLPLATPIWLAALCYLLFDAAGKKYAALGLAYLIVLAELIALHGKSYYLAPAYLMLFAAGAVWIETRVLPRTGMWVKPATVTPLIIGGLIAAPLAMPILPVAYAVKYCRFWNVQAVHVENVPLGDLPQFFADMYGRSEEHTSELQSRLHLVCRLLLEKK